MSDITLTPATYMWEPRVNREHPPTLHLLNAIQHWHAKRMRGKAATYPSIEFWKDGSTRQTSFAVSWLEADLPPGHAGERIVIPHQGSELEWQLHTP